MKKFAGMVVAAVLSFMCLKIVSAEEADIRLQEVVVTATKTEKDPKDVTQSVTVITAEEIKKSGATTAAEAVRIVSGVATEEYGPKGAVQNISIRGASTAQVLVLLDGKRMNSPRTGGYNLTDLPVALEEIERIEIVRGPASALYGADAVGGVVNIITKKADKREARINGSVGSNGFDAISLSASGRKGDVSYRISAGRQTSDGYRENSDLDQKNVGAKLSYDISEDSSVVFTADYLGKEIGVPGSTKYPAPHARQWTRDTVVGFGYRGRVSHSLDISLDGYYSRDVVKYKNPDSFPPDDTRHTSDTRGVELRGNWLANAWNLITIGVEAKGDAMDSSEAGDHAARLAAAYLQDEISIGESLILVVGGRNDSHSIYGDKFSPRASARYLISGTGTILRASAGQSFRAPTFYDLYWPYSSVTFFGTTYITEGNPDLQPESATEYEAGIEQPVGRRATLCLTGFDRKVKNLIDWVETQPNPTTYRYAPENIGKARIRGAEASSKLSVYDSLDWTITYTYMNPVDELTGEKITTIPESQVKSSVSIDLARNASLYVEGRAVRRYGEPSEDPRKYSVFDGKITHTVRLSGEVRGDVFFGMNNVFDRKYEVRDGYPMPPREIYGGVSVRF